MIAAHARYRGREKRRAAYVSDSAAALATLPGVHEFEAVGVEDIRTLVDDADAACTVVMALLSDGGWAVGIGIGDTASVLGTASSAAGTKAGSVGVRIFPAIPDSTLEADITAAFALMAYVLSKRTIEGREATSLVRSGLNQNEAAKELGISKQAMSQRLAAAGWGAEQAGWQLAYNLITQADSPTGSA
ncbi:MarR family transcriptional regulator [Corynebacterium aquatimens]|uniref:DNA-binding protein n=1 Tax=Corynebacterium aquatimens TaxID=1190508 RepID=A0A931GS27_9CORY|nr:MarR family transcriptional regulator [Corynebacterium aquatimens]MBG6121617.1 hypothetical protein [Corynebacterium aquatimens]WJY65844.1 hypothetical protein CAQUA_05680 [Corynebacterium aquatimens]